MPRALGAADGAECVVGACVGGCLWVAGLEELRLMRSRTLGAVSFVVRGIS